MSRFNQVNFRSIRFRLPLLFTLISALPALLSVFWISNVLTDRMEQILQQRVDDGSVVVENVLQQYTEDLLLKGRVVAQAQRIQELLRSRNKIELINELNRMNQDLQLTLYGTVIEVFDENGQLVVSEPKKRQQQVPDRTIYTALRKNEFKVSRFFAGDQLRIATALPIFYADNARAVGAVTLSFNVSDRLADEIHKISASEVLFFRATANNNEGTHARTHAVQLLASTLDESTSHLLIEKHLNNNLRLKDNPDYLMATQKNTARNGVYQLGVAVETREMLATIQSLRNFLYAIALGAALLALLSALVLSRRLVNYIVYLVQAARKVEKGELEDKIHLNSRDELGGLADHLDAMRLEIKSTLEQKEVMITNLTVRDQLNQAIIRKVGNELLKEVLMIIIRSVDAQKGSIMMMDQIKEKLILKVVYDPVQSNQPENVLEEIMFSLGEGIAGEVAEKGEAVICNDTQNDRRFKTYRFQEMDRRIWNMICLPLKVGDKVLGVVSLDNKRDGFAQEDLTRVQHLAGQVAIAVQNAELYERSITDGLTKLFIRRYFEDHLSQEIKRTRRNNGTLALLMFDIDHFKRFNDTYGHQVGDWVIQKVAGVAKDSIRDGVDMPARYGGEEFAVVMPDTDLAGAYHVGERIRKAVENSFVYHEGNKLKITISVGCAVFPDQATDKESLIQFADAALYGSKHKGRNCTTKYTDELLVYTELD